MKRIWNICITTYFDWLFRQQTLLIFPILIFIYINIIEPMQYYASIFDTPLNLLEPFLCILNSVYSVPLMPLSYLFLFAGYPKLTMSTIPQLYRTSKRTWYLGQCLFTLMAVFTFLLCIFTFSILAVYKNAYLANGWSIAIRQIHNKEYHDLEVQSGIAVIDLSVLNHTRPYKAFLQCSLLQLMYMYIAALIDFCFTLYGHKLIGIIVNVISTGLGMFLLLSDTIFKWLVPASHAVFAWHFDQILNHVYMPIWMSFTYNVVLIVVLFSIGLFSVRKCSIMSVLHTEG